MEMKLKRIARDCRKRRGTRHDGMNDIICREDALCLKRKKMLPAGLKNEKGMILLTVLILMFIATILGVIALNNTTVELQISGYDKRISTAFEAAEAGNRLGKMVVDRIADEGKVPTDLAFTVHTSLLREVIFPEFKIDVDTVDFSVSDIGGASAQIDIDALYDKVEAGNSSGFAMGYEGIGSGAADARAQYYRIRTSATK